MRGGKREGAGRKPGSVARIDHEARQKAHASGLTPLEYLLSVLRDESQDERVRLDAAKAAAPYCHNRLSSTEVSGCSAANGFETPGCAVQGGPAVAWLRASGQSQLVAWFALSTLAGVCTPCRATSQFIVAPQ